MVAGFAVCFIPGEPRLEVSSELILRVVLPPLLYSAALNFSVFSFLRNLRPILGLGVSLVKDAAALTLFTIAVSLIAGTHTLFANPVLLFAYAAIVGALLGVALGLVANVLRRYLANTGLETVLETVLGIMLPFTEHSIAEHLGTSFGSCRGFHRLRRRRGEQQGGVPDAVAGEAGLVTVRCAPRGLRLRLPGTAKAIRGGGMSPTQPRLAPATRL